MECDGKICSLLDNRFNRILHFFILMTYSQFTRTQDRSCSNFIEFTYHYVLLVHFRHCLSYRKFYFISTLSARRYTHPSSCCPSFSELIVNLNLKFKSQFRGVSVFGHCRLDMITVLFPRVLRNTDVEAFPLFFGDCTPSFNPNLDEIHCAGHRILGLSS